MKIIKVIKDVLYTPIVILAILAVSSRVMGQLFARTWRHFRYPSECEEECLICGEIQRL